MLLPDFDPTTDLALQRTFAVPAPLIWDCWTHADHIRQFFVPRPHRVTHAEVDPTPGGRFNTTFDVDGQTIVNRGVFLEVVPGTKLVFTDAFTEGWKPAPAPFLTAFLLLADSPDGGTLYTAIARHHSAAAREEHEKMGFHEGWGIAADQLEAYARGLMQ